MVHKGNVTYSLLTDMDKALTILLSKLAELGLPSESSAPQVQTLILMIVQLPEWH